MTKRQRSGFFLLIGLIIILEVIIQFYPDWTKNEEDVSFTPTEEALILKYTEENLSSGESNDIAVKSLTEFNPNALGENGFVEIGFSRKQAKSLIKYRYLVGGNFTSIEQFGESYVISAKKLEELRPYIKLEPVAQNKFKNSTEKPYAKKSFTKVKLKPFNPNKLNHSQWVSKGFSERQAQVILNFKNSLPNKKFSSPEQLHSCYAINDYMFERIKPYLRFEKVLENKSEQIPSKPSTFNVNLMGQADWMQLGFSEEQAESIVKYRAFKGSFKNKEDLKACTFISESEFKRIENQLLLE